MFEKLKTSKSYKILNSIAKSAIFALALSIVLFAFEMYKEVEQESLNNQHFIETVRQLDKVRQSLSTRFLGTFPNYLTEINRVFENLQVQDTVVIFEDVLYYGIKSRPDEFSYFQQLLIRHSRQGGKVIVAYYNNHPDGMQGPIWNTVFHRMILEGRISSAYVPKIREERAEEFRRERGDYSWMVRTDSIITEKYFMRTCRDNRDAAENTWKGYLTPIAKDTIQKSTDDIVVKRVCQQIDSIKQTYLGNGKRLDDVHFADYKRMYSDMTDCIADFYRYNGIELIPLNEYLTMSCWLIKPADVNRSTEAILAFPSKYASDEIGFYSKDASFADYISKMLEGVRFEAVKPQRKAHKLKD